jgi:hypothetical protein
MHAMISEKREEPIDQASRSVVGPDLIAFGAECDILDQHNMPPQQLFLLPCVS